MLAKPPEYVATMWAAANALVPRLLDLTEKLTLIPAPTNDEGRRAAAVAAEFAAIGLVSETDALHNVVATLPGAGERASQSAVLIAAHTDTVFPLETPLTVRRTETTMHGPGIGDNCLGLAAVILLPELLRAVDASPAADLLLTGNVGEEGLGNLRGVRAVMDAHPTVQACAAIEGHNLGRVTHIAVGSKRLRLTATGPGGHSWGDFGQPSAVHAMAKIIAELAEVQLPRVPKTTLNVGLVNGGVSVNTIAPSATCVIDMRSIDADSLQRLVDRVDRIVLAANRGPIRVVSEVLGERPAGIVPLDSPIIKLATNVLGELGMQAAFDASSTDANIAISRGIPAICVGLTHGGRVHHVDEYIDLPPVATGFAQLGLLALALAEGVARGQLRPASRRR